MLYGYSLNVATFKQSTFEEILCLKDYDNIAVILCNNSKLDKLPKLPLNLKKLSCYKNNLTSLPNLPNTLQELYCSENQITHLSKLPKSLEYFGCSKNKLKYLPNLPNSIKSLNFSDNQVTSLSNLSKNIQHVYYNNNPIYNLLKYFDDFGFLSLPKYLKWKEKSESLFVNKIEIWFLECKYNPKYKYCRDRVNGEYEILFEKV
jgi:Leucine-rich repeat (LRR) protein